MRLVIAGLLSALLAAACPAAAVAAVPVAVPVEMQVQLWPAEPEGAVLILSADIAASAPLPATVRIPLPKGATVTWAGEVSPTGVADDIKRDHRVEEGTGGQVVVLTVEKYRSVQVEAAYAAPVAIGSKFTSTLDWVQSAPAGETLFAVKAGPTVNVTAIDPPSAGTPQKNAQGETLFTLEAKKLAPGASYTVAAVFTRGGTAAVTPTGRAAGALPTGTVVLIAVLVGLAVVAVIAILALAARSRGKE